MNESIEKVKPPHDELDRNIDNVDGLIGAAAERNSIAFACRKIIKFILIVELKPKVDEKMRKLEALRRKAKEQERGHALRGVIEQLTKKQNEYKLMEKSLRKKCETLNEEYQKETQKNIEGNESVKQKRELLKASTSNLINK